MFRTVLRRGIPTLCAALLAGALFAGRGVRGGFYAARGYGFGLHRPAYGAIAAGLGWGLGYGYYGCPLDDSYDYPSGYGEYAEYGPWAFQGYSGGDCRLTQRRVRTAYGLRWRTQGIGECSIIIKLFIKRITTM
jgi:hypothetical protein